jgi:hypothetical protein
MPRSKPKPTDPPADPPEDPPVDETEIDPATGKPVDDDPPAPPPRPRDDATSKALLKQISKLESAVEGLNKRLEVREVESRAMRETAKKKGGIFKWVSDTVDEAARRLLMQKSESPPESPPEKPPE